MKLSIRRTALAVFRNTDENGRKAETTALVAETGRWGKIADYVVWHMGTRINFMDDLEAAVKWYGEMVVAEQNWQDERSQRLAGRAFSW